MLAGGAEVGSKFRRGVGGPLVGGVDIMMSSDPRTVVHLACSPLLHYAFRVAKLRGCHDHDGNPYRAVRLYGAYARRPRARADGSHMHDRESCIRASARRPRGVRARARTAIASELLYAVLEQETPTCCLPRRVRFQDAAICPQVVQWPQFEVRCARRAHSCSSHFSC